jgi:outer membrane protein assembly factor BamB
LPIAVVFLLAAAGSWSPAEDEDAAKRVELPGESAGTARRLAAADKLVTQNQVADAVEEYDRLIAEAGDDLVRLSPRHSVQARWLCHLRLAALKPDGLRLYRQRADAKAKKWFEAGRAKRDPRLLRRVVDEAFCCRHAERALDLLGDLAFERGRFDEAEQWWRMLTPPASKSERSKPERMGGLPAIEDLAFPDPQVDVARIRAKQILAGIFRGEGQSARLQQELRAFRASHPKAEGRFAGRTGKLRDILDAILKEHADPQPDDGPSTWPTFAGDSSRSFTTMESVRRLQRLCARPPRWRFDLETREQVEKTEGKPPERVMNLSALNRSLAFHPVIVDNQVLVADARHVTAYDLQTGEPSVWYDVTKEKGGLEDLLRLNLPAPADLRYTLTVANDCVFARLGVQQLSADHKPRQNLSFLVCLRLRPGDKEERLRWQVAPDEANPASVFEGAPVVRDGRAYIAATRVEKGQTITSIHCYPIRTDDTPRPIWRKDICSTQELGPKERRFRHHLLTLAGPRLVYCSHSGAIAALDADTGRRAWAVRYPPRSNEALLAGSVEGNGGPRDLVPCVYSAGRIYAAPADSDRILCLDSDSGRTIWEKRSVEVVHLLGVGRGRLIFTTMKGIQAVDAASGTGPRGWCMPDTEELAPLGRGFLVTNMVFWPTARGLRVLDIEDGQQLAEFVPGVLPAARGKKLVGNLVYANGCLAVANTRELRLYVADAHLRDERQHQAEAEPESATARYRLALAEADAGLDKQAMASFQRAEQLAKKEKTAEHSKTLLHACRAGRHELLLAQARQAHSDKRWEAAAALLRRAAASEFSAADRLRALERLVSMWEAADQPANAVAAWQAILGDDALRRAQMNDADGNPQNAATLAAAQIDALVRVHGEAVYTAIEKQARERLANGEQGIKAIQQLTEAFPNAKVSGPALLELAKLYEKADMPGAATQGYRAFLRRHGKSADRAAVLAQLARLYEQEHCWVAARTTWERLADIGGDSVVPAVDGDRPVRAVVARELEKPAYVSLRKSPPSPAAPLLRAWEGELDNEERLLIAEDPEAVGIGEVMVFLGSPENGGKLTCRATATGGKLWERSLAFVPSWTGSYADTVIAGGQAGVSCVRVADGQPLWDFSAPDALTAFRISSTRLFFLDGCCRLFALDVETGQVLWSRWAPAARLGLPPPAGQFGVNYHADDERLLVQTSGGRRWLLDPQTGRTLVDAETSRAPWPQPPLILDGKRACLVTEPHRVVRLDLADGKEAWSYELARTTSLTGEPPELLGNGESLFVLIPRNFGTSVQRLDPRTGKPDWNEERLLTTETIATDQVSCDRTTLYYVSGNVLHADRLGDGKSLWDRPVLGPAGPWRTFVTPELVLTYPVNIKETDIHFGSFLKSVEWTTAVSQFSVDLCDLRTGQLVQRLNVTNAGPKQTLNFAALVRARDDKPVVWFISSGLLVSAAGKIVRFK